MTVNSFIRRFGRYNTYKNAFGFLVSIERLKYFVTCLKHDSSLDLDVEILFKDCIVLY